MTRTQTPRAITARPFDAAMALALLAALLLGASPLMAAEGAAATAEVEAPRQTPQKTPQQRLTERITIDLEEASLEETLKAFGSMLQVEVELASDLEGEVSLTLHRVTVGTALDVLCESHGCRWELAEERLLFTADPDFIAWAGPRIPWAAPRQESRPTAPGQGPQGNGAKPAASPFDEPITLQLEAADTVEVFRSFARILEVDLDISHGFEETVTVDLENVSVRQALEEVSRRVRANWQLTGRGEDRALHVRAVE